jgi:hypothetical protein
MGELLIGNNQEIRINPQEVVFYFNNYKCGLSKAHGFFVADIENNELLFSVDGEGVKA